MRNRILARPIHSGEALDVGLVGYVDSAKKISILDGPTNQAGTAAVKPAGIIMVQTGDADERTSVCYEGDYTAIAGASIAQGDVLVAQYETGRVIPFADTAYTDGTIIYTVGRALEDCASGSACRIFVDIQSRAIATAPAAG